MKIFTTKQMRLWDQFTMENRQIASIDLMESAARECSAWLEREGYVFTLCVFAGTGNNGGDGLCIARHFIEKDMGARVYIVGNAEEGTPDFKANLQRLIESDAEVNFLSEAKQDFIVHEYETIIDTILGTGITRPVSGWLAQLIEKINAQPNKRIAIDIPSGLLADQLSIQHGTVIQANHTLTFEVPKPAFLFAENYPFVGDFHLLPMGLDNRYHDEQKAGNDYYEMIEASKHFRPRKKFTFKNERGHLQLIAGSRGKIGAAILASGGASRAGCGLVTAHLPQYGCDIIQSAMPEIMCEADGNLDILATTKVNNERSALAIGPGMGTSHETAEMLKSILHEVKIPMVLDADALNIIAHHNLHAQLPHNCVITPHIGEFDRLFGKHENSFARFETLKKKSVEHQIVIVLKGAHTAVASPDGMISFNASGNAGMATAGCGDVLCGVIGSLLAQGYAPEVAARLGVFLHGHAADALALEYGEEGMMASDIACFLQNALNDVAEAAEFR